jgi:hypothetical protein
MKDGEWQFIDFGDGSLLDDAAIYRNDGRFLPVHALFPDAANSGKFAANQDRLFFFEYLEKPLTAGEATIRSDADHI